MSTDSKSVILEALFPDNLFASTDETKSST